jgi:tetratricopeptide (TPR) repeat protein
MSATSESHFLEAQVRRLWDEAQDHREHQRYQQALAALEACRDLLAPTGHAHSQYSVWFEIGRLQEELGRFAAARPAYERALACAERVADPRLQATTCHRLGHVLRLAGKPAEARAWFERAAAHADQGGDRGGLALSRAMLGQILFTDGQHEAGLRQMLQALVLLPAEAPEHGHLMEHTAYFSLRVEDAAFQHLLEEAVPDPALRERLRSQRSARQAARQSPEAGH